MTEDWCTAADIAFRLRRPDGQPVFSSPSAVRKWIHRHREAGRITHHPTWRQGPRDARLYDWAQVEALYWVGKRKATAPTAADRESPAVGAGPSV